MTPASSSITAFIGGGNMAGALIGGLRRGGTAAADILVVEPGEEQRERLQREFGVQAQPAAGPSLRVASLVVWAVKPQSFEAAAVPCRAHVAGAAQLSVMAGVRSEAVVRASGSARVLRAMPNTPALIGQGIAGLYARPEAAAHDRSAVEALLAPTGRLLWVDHEADLDAVTALSGSGPAYVFLFIEALMEAARDMGLNPQQGRALALATFAGATALAEQSPLTPAALREQVTSKGGTTHAALSAMQEDGVREAIVRGVRAAQQRAAELGDEFGR